MATKGDTITTLEVSRLSRTLNSYAKA